MKLIHAFLSVFLAGSLHAKIFQPIELISGDQQTPVIELYTSEGCSSCSPADEWLSALKQQQNLWQDFIPLAFHVDYWDYIGWKDRFASKQFTNRQRLYALEFGERTVYTPGMRILGQEWQTWRRATPVFMAGLGKELETMNVGVLSVNVDDKGQFNAKLETKDGNNDQDYLFNIAILGMDISTDVKRGENHGKTLHHDFVVLGLETFTSEDFQWIGQLPAIKNEAPRYALVAWVAEKSSLVPKQAVGGYLASF